MNKGVMIGIITGVIVIIAIVLIFSLSGDKSSESGSLFRGEVIEIKSLPNLEVIEKINEANSKINKFDIVVIQKQQISIEFFGETNEIDIEIDYRGTIDNINREMHFEGNAVTISQGQKQEGVFELTIKNNIMTSNVAGEVTTITLNDEIWRQYNSVDYSLNGLNPGFRYEGDEGKYYVLISDIDIGQAGTVAQGIENSGLKEAYVKLWVDKSDLIVKKTQTYVVIESEGLSMVVDIQTTISNIS